MSNTAGRSCAQRSTSRVKNQQSLEARWIGAGNAIADLVLSMHGMIFLPFQKITHIMCAWMSVEDIFYEVKEAMRRMEIA